jgi:hypothetical protein
MVMRDGSARGHVFVVSTPQDLRTLPSPRLAPARVSVELALPGLDGPRRGELEQRLARQLAVCGCKEGSVAVLLYLVAVPILAFAGPLAPGSALGWLALFGGLLGASLLGKVAGLAVAHMRLLQVVAEIEDTIRDQAKRGVTGCSSTSAA